MARQKKAPAPSLPIYVQSWAGTLLTVLSGLSFLLVCMLLPLVGQAGANTSFADKSRTTFTAYLVLSIFLSLAAIFSKLMRRKLDRSPLPMFSFVLCVLGLLLLVALMADWLGV